MDPARLAAAEERLSRLSTQISSAESAITDKEAELHQRAALVEANLVRFRLRPGRSGPSSRLSPSPSSSQPQP